MRLSTATHQQLEEFFREYFADEKLKLPAIEIYHRRGAGIVTKITSVLAITFGRFVFVKPDLICRNDENLLCISRELLVHETTHVLQYRKLGWVKFFYTYLKEYRSNLRSKQKRDLLARAEAYLEIPHEIEARACAAEFLKWREKAESNAVD